MVFTKKKTYPKKTYPKKTTKKGGPMTVARVTTIAKKVAKGVSETKKHSKEIIENSLSTNSTVNTQYPLQLAQGTGYGQRIGHQIYPIGMDLRGHIITQTQSSATIVRVMVVRIKDNNASIPGDLLEVNTNNVSASSNDISKMYRRINADSFEVLKSKYLNLTPKASGYRATQLFKMWIPLKKLGTLQYEGSGVISPTRNNIAIVVFGADAVNDASNFTFELTYNSTFYYKDP